jgi:hypothetical protein
MFKYVICGDLKRCLVRHWSHSCGLRRHCHSPMTRKVSRMEIIVLKKNWEPPIFLIFFICAGLGDEICVKLSKNVCSAVKKRVL